jgi:hypothetical protein
MSDETQAQEAETSKRKSVSQRDYLAADGTVVKRMEEAAGARYTLKDESGKPLQAFECEMGEPGSFVTMCAILGFHTKVGNVANSVLNDKDAPGSAADAAAEIADFLAGAQNADDPTWAERTGGVGGAKVDRDALTAAIVEVMGKATGKQLDPLAIRQRLDDDPKFFRAMRQVAEITENYVARVGKASGKTTADVAAMFS